MNSENLKEIWIKGDTLYGNFYSYIREELKNLGLSKKTIEFLVQVGFPSDAAPFLAFDDRFRTVTDIYTFLDSSFKPLIHIGSDGEGSPIVINTAKNDQIELLDHEYEFAPLFINSSIEDFFYFLLYYRDFVTAVNLKNEHAFLNSDYSAEDILPLKNKMEKRNSYDSSTGFWKREVDGL